MKKLSKLFLVLTLVCSVSFSVACGGSDAAEIEKLLKDGGYTVTTTTGKSQYISQMYLSESALKGGFTEIVAKSTGFLPDEDLNFVKVANGNFIADEDGDYVYDDVLGAYRLANSGEDGNFSPDANLYYPETDGDYVYDTVSGAYVKDEDVNFFDVVDDAFYYDGNGNFVRNDSVDYIEDKGGRYVADKGGKFVYDAESQKIVEIVVGKFFDKVDNKYNAYNGEDTTGKYVRDAKISTKYYVFDGVFYAFDKKGDYVYDAATSEYVKDEDVNYSANYGGNYKENSLGKYVYDNKLEQYVLDTDVNYVQNGYDYLPSVNGTFVKVGDEFVSETGSRASVKYNGQNYDIDNTRYVKSGENYVVDKLAKYYEDGCGNYVKNNDAGNLIKDGSSFVADTRAKYIKLTDDLYILDDENVEYYSYSSSNLVLDTAGQRYAKVARYETVANRDDATKIYYEYDGARGSYILDKDKNFEFLPDRYVPIENRTPGADGKIYKYGLADDNNNIYGYIVDNDVNYNYDEVNDTYVADVNGEFKQENVYIVVLAFEKKKDAKEIYDDLYGDFYASKCYEELYGKVKKGYVSARKGKIIYIGYVDYLDVLGDYRF